MTDIDHMEAGPEINAMVAKDVIGEVCTCVHGTSRHLGCAIHSAKEYSTDIATASEVLEKIKASNEIVQAIFCEEIEAAAYDYDRAQAQARSGRGHYPRALLRIIWPSPEAICRAALKAVKGDDEPH